MWLAAKGMGVANMVRLGVLEARGEGILNSPKPNRAYFARSDTALQLWAQEVFTAFRRGSDALYALVLKIFRSAVTNHLVAAGEFPSRPSVQDRINTVPSSSKRPAATTPDLDDSEDECPVRRRR